MEVLSEILPERGMVLEIASGTGEHAVAFARAFPHLMIQPSDPDPPSLRSIDAWRRESALFNLLPPLSLDVRSAEWPIDEADAVVCINMLHISAASATAGLMRGAGALLAVGAPLYVYGPFRQREVETAPSNEAFDESLRARNAEWGLRYVEDVEAEAGRHELALERIVPMPANNLSLVFRKVSAG